MGRYERHVHDPEDIVQDERNPPYRVCRWCGYNKKKGPLCPRCRRFPDGHHKPEETDEEYDDG